MCASNHYILNIFIDLKINVLQTKYICRVEDGGETYETKAKDKPTRQENQTQSKIQQGGSLIFRPYVRPILTNLTRKSNPILNTAR